MLNSLQELISAFIHLIVDRIKLFKLEAELARRSFIPFFFSLAFFIIAGAFMWLFTLLLSGYVIYLWRHDIVLAIAIAALLNSLVFLMLAFLMIFFFHRILFPYSRKHLKWNRSQQYDESLNPTDQNA
ncbi:MAG: hypothetical protein A3F41_02675 [Coxiella sp. RIFCSPHIGHO2_12_FULL_44_14]|nr:MAG: hypothetical protein A3F41_02675 [Coxiella sp. RIFCSPHIGHO2_12_FULL_44_14]